MVLYGASIHQEESLANIAILTTLKNILCSLDIQQVAVEGFSKLLSIQLIQERVSEMENNAALSPKAEPSKFDLEVLAIRYDPPFVYRS